MMRFLLCLFLLLGSPVWADEGSVSEESPLPVVTAEEERMLELLELLLNYEMLHEIDVLADMEEDQ